MLHMAYPTRKPLEAGVQVSVLAHLISAGDSLAVEYPDNSRDTAEVIRSSANILEIDIGGRRWRLAPLAPHEMISVPTKFDKKPLVVWSIQPD